VCFNVNLNIFNQFNKWRICSWVCELGTLSQHFDVVNNPSVTLSPYWTVRDGNGLRQLDLRCPYHTVAHTFTAVTWAPLQNPYRTEPRETWVASVREFTDVISKSRVHKLPVPVGRLSYAICTAWVKELRIMMPLFAKRRVHSLLKIEFSTECNPEICLRISSFFLLISSKSPSSWLHLLPRLPVILFFPVIFLSITCFGRRSFFFEFPVFSSSFLQSNLAAAYIFFIVSPSFYSSL